MNDEQLVDELRALGRSVVQPPVADGLTTAVLDRIAGTPVRRRLRDRWRALLALLGVLLVGAAVAPPVRAVVAEWLNIGGVEARPVGSGPSTAPGPPAVTGKVADPARLAGFVPVVPGALGEPDGLSADQRLVAMSWQTPHGTVRLEQFRGQVSPLYVKKYYSGLEHVQVGAAEGFWFSTPHELVVEEPGGTERRERIAGPTLVWVYAGLTFRLEGLEKDRAVEVAGTAVR